MCTNSKLYTVLTVYVTLFEGLFVVLYCDYAIQLYQSHNNLIVLLIDTLESIKKKNLIQYNKIAIAVVKLHFIFTMS